MLDYRMNTFLILCETMNYHETAERLHMTQPAVTQHIQFLEQAYGQQLFAYEKRRLRKTQAAVTLESYARAMRYNEQELRQRLQTGAVPALRVGATKTIGDYVLPAQIKRFLRGKENALTLIVDNTEHLLRFLEENQLDFAIVEGYFNKKQFDSRLLRQEPFVGICPKGHSFAGREITVPELLGETLLHREEGSGTRAILEQKLLAYNESFDHFRRNICVSSMKLILELVREGFGVSFVYQVLAENDPDLDQFSLQGEDMVREFNLVWLQHAAVAEKIDLFFA